MEVLITDGHQRSAVAAVRSLGRQGVKVTVGESRADSLAACSRYCSEQFVYPAPARDPLGFQESLLARIQARPSKLIIPMTDLTCTLCAEIADELRKHTRLALPEGDSYLRASDKAELLKLALALDVPIPRTLFPESPDEVESLAAEIEFPVVIKARRSRVRVGNGFRFGQVSYAFSKEELVANYRTSHESIAAPILQERIAGPGCGLFALFHNGEPLALFEHRRLREKPPSGGVSVLRESAELNREICEYSRKLLQALNWSGVAMVEFKLDSTDNTPKLMEINGRFWGSLQLAIDCGLDFPYWLYQLSQGEKPVVPTSYPIGVKSRWFLGDLDHLLAIWLRRRGSLSLPANYPGRLGVLGDFLVECFRSSKNELWTSDDPGPGRREIRDYLHSVLRKLRLR